jgi:hypothetical protein
MRDTVEWGVLTYTCHPFVIGRGARMMMLERVIRTAADSGAVFLTLEEAVREFQQRAGSPARLGRRGRRPARQRMKSPASVK